MSRRKQCICCVILILFFALLLSLIIALEWRGFWCVHTDIDIMSGDIRHQRYVAFFLVDKKVLPTGFSELSRTLFADQPKPVWRRASTEPILRSRISYGFNRTISECSTLLKLFVVYDVPESEQLLLMRKFRNFLRESKPRQFTEELEELETLLETRETGNSGERTKTRDSHEWHEDKR